MLGPGLGLMHASSSLERDFWCPHAEKSHGKLREPIPALEWALDRPELSHPIVNLWGRSSGRSEAGEERQRLPATPDISH